MDLETLLGWLVLVMVVGLGIGAGDLAYRWGEDHPCVRSHFETHYRPPITMNVGGSKYGGGIGIPLGDITPEQVEVCDERK